MHLSAKFPPRDPSEFTTPDEQRVYLWCPQSWQPEGQGFEPPQLHHPSDTAEDCKSLQTPANIGSNQRAGCSGAKSPNCRTMRENAENCTPSQQGTNKGFAANCDVRSYVAMVHTLELLEYDDRDGDSEDDRGDAMPVFQRINDGLRHF